MKNMIRALRMALRYRWSLIIALLSSVGVAVMWGANIGAVAPFIKVIFENQSLHQWIDAKIETDQQSIERTTELAATIEIRIVNEPVESEKQLLRYDLVQITDQTKAYSYSLWMSQFAEPYIKKYTPTTAYQTLIFLICFVIMGTFVRGLFLVVNMYLVARLGQRTVLDMQNQFFQNTLHMELSEIGKNGTGDLISRIRGETGAIGMAITTLLGKTIREPLKMVACLTGAALLNWRLLLFSLLVCPIAAVLMVFLARSMKQLNKRAVEESARLLNRLFQSITYIKAVKSFNMESHELKRFQTIASDVYRKSMRMSMLGALSRLNNELLGVSIICIGILGGGYLVLNREQSIFGIQMCETPMEVSTMMTFFAFLVASADPLRKMGDVYTLIQGGIVAADRVFPLLDKKSSIISPTNPVPMGVNPPSVTFEGLSFAYVKGTPVLQNINIEIPAGKSVAIVGANGCGKSTLVNFLPRFFDPDSGCAKLDGVDVRNYSLRDLRQTVGLVTQQSMLFDDTIANNIAYGLESATREQIIDAAKQASAHDFIVEQLENGYESSIGEHGGKLSGGQRQRLELARAILKNPKVLILDEATSQIDPTSEQLIHQTLRQFIKNRTVIMITHRMSTLELADMVVVMDAGIVVDFGTHEELMDRCDKYRAMREIGFNEVADLSESLATELPAAESNSSRPNTTATPDLTGIIRAA